MSEQKQILVLPRDHGLSANDRRQLRKIGIVVVTVAHPHLVRFISSEPFPATSNDLLMAAFEGLRKSGSMAQASAWNQLAILFANQMMAKKEPVKIKVVTP